MWPGDAESKAKTNKTKPEKGLEFRAWSLRRLSPSASTPLHAVTPTPSAFAIKKTAPVSPAPSTLLSVLRFEFCCFRAGSQSSEAELLGQGEVQLVNDGLELVHHLLVCIWRGGLVCNALKNADRRGEVVDAAGGAES